MRICPTCGYVLEPGAKLFYTHTSETTSPAYCSVVCTMWPLTHPIEAYAKIWRDALEGISRGICPF